MPTFSPSTSKRRKRPARTKLLEQAFTLRRHFDG
jgi:hypothetical protein